MSCAGITMRKGALKRNLDVPIVYEEDGEIHTATPRYRIMDYSKRVYYRLIHPRWACQKIVRWLVGAGYQRKESGAAWFVLSKRQWKTMARSGIKRPPKDREDGFVGYEEE